MFFQIESLKKNANITGSYETSKTVAKSHFAGKQTKKRMLSSLLNAETRMAREQSEENVSGLLLCQAKSQTYTLE